MSASVFLLCIFSSFQNNPCGYVSSHLHIFLFLHIKERDGGITSATELLWTLPGWALRWFGFTGRGGGAAGRVRWARPDRRRWLLKPAGLWHRIWAGPCSLGFPTARRQRSSGFNGWWRNRGRRREELLVWDDAGDVATNCRWWSGWCLALLVCPERIDGATEASMMVCDDGSAGGGGEVQ